MPTTFRIPKLTDREITAALGRIRNAFRGEIDFQIIVHVPVRGEIGVPDENPEENAELQFLFSFDSQVVNRFELRDSSLGQTAFLLERHTDEITDSLQFRDEWPNHRRHNAPNQFTESYVKLIALTRSEFKASDVEAALKGGKAGEWNRYRNAQTAVLNSLQQATETLIVGVSEKNAELDKARSERFEKLESELRAQLQAERERIQQEFDSKEASLTGREQALSAKEAAFNTKEARYVARAKQDEQITQVKSWLEDWQLTKGTSRKRWPIVAGYSSAILATGWLTGYSVHHNYQILGSAADIAKLSWWQWIAIMSKALFPLAACTTFIVYFIRWTSAWARQHADEEFRNRALLIDIGRSSWLLEAVRDAQERQKEIPPDLLKELSRNMFSYSASPDADVHPQAISDILLQGLSSVRVKSSDGSEVEATRAKK